MFEPLDAGRPRRSVWVTIVSFALETAGIGAFVLLPLIYTSAIPVVQPGEVLTLPYSSPEPEHVGLVDTHPDQSQAPTETPGDGLVQPPDIPEHTDRSSGPAAPEPSGPAAGPYLPLGISGYDRVLSPLVASVWRPAPAAPPSAPVIRQVSVMELGSLVRMVQPVYPMPARVIHLQGDVVLRAIINTRGEVTEIGTVSGHPLLAAAARDAVRQWRYRPYRLNGEFIPVETQITVHFTIEQ